MSDATCKTCPFWEDVPHAFNSGLCRRNPPAPRPQEPDGNDTWSGPADWCSEHPLRQRDRIAAMAMPAASRRWLADEWDSTTPGIIAADAYAVADAMLAESAKGTK